MRTALAAVFVLTVAVGVWFAWPNPPAPVARKPLWIFQAPERGGIVAAPLVVPGGIYVASYHARGFRLRGAATKLDPATGRPLWTFTHDGAMLASVSSPAEGDGRIYVGEGMHANFVCNLYALDAALGTKLFSVPTDDHIESGVALGEGRAYFGAGNDGVLAIDARTGEKRWQFAEEVHVDTTPELHAGRVYFGSGPSRKFRAARVGALDAASGKKLWLEDVPLPAWGGATAANGRIYVGLGNGRLTEGAVHPAGAVRAFDAATGAVLWHFPTADAVFQKPCAVEDRVLFGCRDGNLYGATSAEGRELFRVALGGPIIARPAIDGSTMYVATTNGLLHTLTTDGQLRHTLDLAKLSGTTPRIFAPVVCAAGRVYVAGEFGDGESGYACLYCFDAQTLH